MRKTLIFLILLFLTANSTGFFIGTTPGVKDLGKVERGKTYEITFYLTADTDQTLVMDPVIGTPAKDTYSNDNINNFEYDPDKASMERIGPWVGFKKPKFKLDPTTSERVKVQGGSIEAQGKVSFFLEIPRDAEPGYHMATLHLKPKRESGGEGIVTYGIATPTIVFRVPGEVEQELEIVDVKGLRSGDTSAYVDVRVKNTGTVTTTIDEGDFTLYDANGREMKNFEIGSKYIEAGETKTVRLQWSQGEDIPAGNYRLRGNVNYFTGQAFLDETFDITSFIQIEQDNSTEGGIIPSTGDSEGEGLPVWLVVMFIVLIGAIMYSFEVDPLLIILALGALGISIYILMAGLPVFLVAVVILMSVVLFYYGWM